MTVASPQLVMVRAASSSAALTMGAPPAEITHVIPSREMGKSGRRLLILLTLALWVVSGPVGMAFDGCAMMGAMCEAPCGVLSYIAGPVVTDLDGLQPLAYLGAPSTAQPPVVSVSPLTPPPKSTLRSA